MDQELCFFAGNSFKVNKSDESKDEMGNEVLPLNKKARREGR